MRFFRCLPVVFSLKSIGHQSFYNSFYFPRAEFWLLENILLRRNSLHSFWYEINYFEFSTRLNMAVSRSALKDSHITHVHSCSAPVNGKGFSCSIENLNKSFWCIRSPKKRICFSSTVTNPDLFSTLIRLRKSWVHNLHEPNNILCCMFCKISNEKTKRWSFITIWIHPYAFACLFNINKKPVFLNISTYISNISLIEGTLLRRLDTNTSYF